MFVIVIGTWITGQPNVECVPYNLRVEHSVRNKQRTPKSLATLRGTNMLYILCIFFFCRYMEHCFPSDVSIYNCGLSVVSIYMCGVKCKLFLFLAQYSVDEPLILLGFWLTGSIIVSRICSVYMDWQQLLSLDGAAYFGLQIGFPRSLKLDMFVLMAAKCASCVKDRLYFMFDLSSMFW